MLIKNYHKFNNYFNFSFFFNQDIFYLLLCQFKKFQKLFPKKIFPLDRKNNFPNCQPFYQSNVSACTTQSQVKTLSELVIETTRKRTDHKKPINPRTNLKKNSSEILKERRKKKKNHTQGPIVTKSKQKFKNKVQTKPTFAL